MLPKLIAITGKAGAGKDTLADHLVRMGAVKYSFALPLKQALNAMFGWSMEQWNDREWKERTIPWLGKSPRFLAQTIGTEWGRDIVHPELWVRIAEQRYIEHIDNFDNERPFVIPDCRFDNEARMVQQLGGVVIKVVRNDVKEIETHLSERGVDPTLINWNVMNDRSIPEFLAAAVYGLRQAEIERK